MDTERIQAELIYLLSGVLMASILLYPATLITDLGHLTGNKNTKQNKLYFIGTHRKNKR